MNGESNEDELVGLFTGVVMAAVVVAVLVGGIWLIATSDFFSGYKGKVARVFIMAFSVCLCGGIKAFFEVFFRDRPSTGAVAAVSFFVLSVGGVLYFFLHGFERLGIMN